MHCGGQARPRQRETRSTEMPRGRWLRGNTSARKRQITEPAGRKERAHLIQRRRLRRDAGHSSAGTSTCPRNLRKRRDLSPLSQGCVRLRGWVGFAYRGSRGHPPTCPYLVGLAEEAPTHPKTLHGVAKEAKAPLHCTEGPQASSPPPTPLRPLHIHSHRGRRWCGCLRVLAASAESAG